MYWQLHARQNFETRTQEPSFKMQILQRAITPIKSDEKSQMFIMVKEFVSDKFSCNQNVCWKGYNFCQG